MAGNVERKNDQSYADDGISQVAVMTVGAAARADVKVPNPVTLPRTVPSRRWGSLPVRSCSAWKISGSLPLRFRRHRTASGGMRRWQISRHIWRRQCPICSQNEDALLQSSDKQCSLLVGFDMSRY